MKLEGMDIDSDSIAFSRNEWKHFLDELKMRGTDKIAQCVNNARYLAKLDRAEEQLKNGEYKEFTWEEWKEFAKNAQRAVS